MAMEIVWPESNGASMMPVKMLGRYPLTLRFNQTFRYRVRPKMQLQRVQPVIYFLSNLYTRTMATISILKLAGGCALLRQLIVGLPGLCSLVK